MGYFDSPETEEFLGCPVCGGGESDLIESESKEDSTCQLCGSSQNWAWKNLNKLYVPIWEQQTDPEWEELSDEDLAALESIDIECERERYLDAGWIDENGELTDRYYRESDFQFDVARERNRK